MPVPRSRPPSSWPRPRSRTTPCPPVINLDAPQWSRILSKGAHSGPALDAGAASAILTWIEAEKTAADPTGSGATLVQTAHFKPLLCSSGAAGGASCPYNNVTLDALGAGGASIQLVVQELGTGIYVNEMQLIGGTGSGAYIEHPLFVSYPTGADPNGTTISGVFGNPKDS